MRGHGAIRYAWASGHGVCRGILRTCTIYSFISCIIFFCIVSNFHKFDQMNREKNMVTIDFNLDQIASSIFEDFFQE
jgi:hypothetical protein